MRRTLIIGDVHGCADELKLLLDKTKFDPLADQLVFVGDLIHKGPKSKEVLEIAHASQAICIKGNHELKFLKSLKSDRHEIYETQKLKKQLSKELDFWAGWIQTWPLTHSTKDHLIVHAGLAPRLSHKRTPAEWLCNIRTWDGAGNNLSDMNNPAWFEFYRGRKKVVFGHWARLGLHKKKNVLCLDSGCVYGVKLSAYDTRSKRIYQVDALKTYVRLP